MGLRRREPSIFMAWNKVRQLAFFWVCPCEFCGHFFAVAPRSSKHQPRALSTAHNPIAETRMSSSSATWLQASTLTATRCFLLLLVFPRLFRWLGKHQDHGISSQNKESQTQISRRAKPIFCLWNWAAAALAWAGRVKYHDRTALTRLIKHSFGYLGTVAKLDYLHTQLS